MILAQIHNKFRELPPAEQRIASFVLEDPLRVTRMTVREVADACETAQSAVIRFCRSVGADGFTALKIALAQESGRPAADSPVMPAFSRDDDLPTVFRKVFHSGIGTLNDTLDLLDFDKIRTIADRLFHATKINIFGIGTSAIVADDAYYRFSQLGLPAVSCTDVLFMEVAAANMKPDEVALFISHSGMTRCVVDAMRHARKAGAVTVVLTSHSNSILYRECDLAVSVYADEENYPVEAVSARMAHLCLIDAFMMAMAAMDYDSMERHIACRNRILDEIRYH